MVRLLPPECLQEIFKIFEDDKTTLHSCLLVNRYWSSCAAPLLWGRPFELSRLSSQLVETYSNFFDKKSRKILSASKILIKHTQKQCVFDYPRFIKSLQYSHVYDFSSTWLQEGQAKGHQKFYMGFETTNMCRIFVK